MKRISQAEFKLNAKTWLEGFKKIVLIYGRENQYLVFTRSEAIFWVFLKRHKC